MTDSFWEVIANTPWWVFLLFGCLLRLGYLARKPRLMSLKNLYLLPTILFVFSLISLYYTVQFALINVLIWFGALVLGVSLGWLQYRALKVKAERTSGNIYIPGTGILLILVLIIFSTKFYFGYEIALYPSIILQPKYYLALILFYGLFTGLFLGRLLYARRCIKHGPFLDTTTSPSR